MASILNSAAALGASRQLGIVGNGLQQTIQRLTTGRRINKASDDAAGLGISNKLSADIRVAAQGKRNANDGTSYLQVADGVLDAVGNLLTRAAELAQQAQTGTISDANRTNLDTEFQNILKTVIDISQNTTFNGAAVFSGTAMAVAVGGYSSVSITVGTISTSTTDALGLGAGVTTTSTSSTTVSGASSSAGTNVASALSWAASSGGYYLGYVAANNWSPAAGTQMWQAYNDWFNGTGDPAGETSAVQATAAAFVAANPGDANGIAALAALTYLVNSPTPAPASPVGGLIANSNGLAAAVAASSNTFTTTTTTTSGGDSLTTTADAAATATKLTAALDSVSNVRASLGASMQQLGAVGNALGIQVENFTAAYSQIMDANIADEVVNLSKFQILNQSGTNALSQANSAQQQILALLR